MPVLDDPRHEAYAQLRFSGMGVGKAHKQAGFAGNSPASASALEKNLSIRNRIKELGAEKAKHLVQPLALTQEYAIEGAVDNLEKALGRRPVKIGKKGEETEVYVYRGEVANGALRLIGAELGLFKEQKEVRHLLGEYEKLSNEDLVRMLQEESQKLLDHKPMIDVTPDSGDKSE